jgi:Sulfotransferase family
MGDFAVDVAIGYQVGAARGNLSILSAMEITPAKFFANFGQSINDLILAHRTVLEQKRKLDTTSARRHATVGPKARWVDGTPEYSLHICGLRKLFPEALFIHLVRDVDAVVRSLLNFHRVSGIRLVANEEGAYKHWLRRAKACLKAEQAYGSKVVRRLSYSTLIDNPELAMQSLLSFVGEPYSARCLEPLRERINSSNVPPDFKSDDPATDRAIVEEARRLSAEMQQAAQPSEPSAAAADEIEEAYRERVKYMATLDSAYKKTQQIIKALNHAALPLYVMTQAALAIADPCLAVLSQLS